MHFLKETGPVTLTPSNSRLRRRGERGFSLPELMISVVIVGVLGSLGTNSYRTQVNQSKSIEAVSMVGNIQKSVMFSTGNTEGVASDSISFTKSYGAVSSFGKPESVSEKQAEKAADDSSTETSSTGNKDGGIDGDGNKGIGDNVDEDGEQTKCDCDNPNAAKFCGEGVCGDDGSDSGSATGGNELCGSADPVPSSIDSVKGKSYRASASDYGGNSDTGWQCLHVSRNGGQNYQYGYDVGTGTVSGASQSYTAWARGDVDGDGRNSYFKARGNLVDGSVVNSAAIEIVDSAE